MGSGPALRQILDARSSIQRAILLSNTADLAALSEARGLLETAVECIASAHASISAGADHRSLELREHASLLARDAGRIMRVIDACAGLTRALALRAGALSIGYSSSGAIQGTSQSALAIEVQA